jgi:hypothetical protein
MTGLQRPITTYQSRTSLTTALSEEMDGVVNLLRAVF